MTLLDELYERYKIPSHRLKEGQQKTKCPECQPQHDPTDNPLSIEIFPDKILFKCHHCGFSGGVVAKSPSRAQSYRKPAPQPKVLPQELDADGCLEFFKSRSISEDTYKAFDCFAASDGWIGFPYNRIDGKADNIKYRHTSKKFRQEKDPVKSLYNYQRVKDASRVVFVEGEIDALSCYEAGVQEVTTLPDGAPAQTAFKDNDKRFAALTTHPLKAEKIVLFCDADGAGANLRKELLHRYGKGKCWYVKPPQGCKDANDVLMKHGANYLCKLIMSAKPYPVDGLYTVRNYYDDVIDLYHGNYDRPIEIGYPALDSIYKVMKGTFHVWTGIPNHGKSTFLDQCLIQIAQRYDWKFAMFSPEHSTKMHIRRLAQMVVQKPFDKGVTERMTEEELVQGMAWLQEHFFFIETREHIPSIDKILATTKETVAKHGCNALVIDPYNEVDASRKGSYREDEHIRDFISKCKRFSKNHDLTTFVVAHPTKLQKEDGGYKAPSAYDISGAAHWHNQADAVVVVHRDFDAGTIQVITRKIREQGLYGQIGEATFWMNPDTRMFEEPKIGAWDGYRSAQ